jgi:septal ring factor EnvC (AmiA/AmiB activator)
MKIVKGTIITFVITTLLVFLGAIGNRGLTSIVQEKAKEAVQDTIGNNSEKIKKLEILVEQNIKEDIAVHPEINVLKVQINNIETKIDDLRKQLDELRRGQEKLTELLIKYMQAK